MRRILVAYDGSDGGRRALDRGITEARESRGRITVLSVEEVPLDPNAPRNFGTPDDIAAWEGGKLAPPPDVVAHLEQASDVLSAAGLDAELTWAVGEPGQTIVETARQIDADVIIVGAHHHGRLASFFGENVDAEVEREARCEVILA
jgi:nucleotide-binding universal stress UspA family protein